MNLSHSWVLKIFQSHSDRQELEPILVWGFSYNWLVLKQIPSCLGIYWSHGAFGLLPPRHLMPEVDFWWWIDHATTSPSVTWQIFVGRFEDLRFFPTEIQVPPEVLCLICMFLGCQIPKLRRCGHGCLGFEKWWKRKGGGTWIKTVGIGLMDCFFWLISLNCPSLTTEVPYL